MSKTYYAIKRGRGFIESMCFDGDCVFVYTTKKAARFDQSEGEKIVKVKLVEVKP
jgi:hypothetical protein